MNKLTRQSQKGFTLIELLLYVAVASAMLVLISAFLVQILQSRIKNQTIAEIEQQGLQVMNIITQTVRNADGIISPSRGNDASSLTLGSVEIDNDPTIFDIVDEAVYIGEGGESPIALTNSRVIASDLIVQNLSRLDTLGIIRIQFTLSHINPENRNEYNYEKTFFGSASLRHP